MESFLGTRCELWVEPTFCTALKDGIRHGKGRKET
jgi:hypothetical protein